MNRFLRALIVITAILIVALTAFLMGFGAAAAFLVSDTVVRSEVAAAPAPIAPFPTYTPAAVAPAGQPTPTTQLAPAPTQAPATSSGVVRNVQDRFQIFWEALRRISDNFYDQGAVDTQKIIYGAIKGMVESLDDPNTYFSPPEQVQRSRDDLEGAFEGIGATIEKKDDRLLIVAPIAGTPAQRAGLRPGDWIIKIDGKETTNLSVNDGVNLIRGPRSSSVTLTIVREGTKDPFDVKITRDVINVPNVKLTILDGNIAHIQLVNVFSSKMSDDLKAALREAKDKGANKVILDVRGNPGGYLVTSVEVASQFLKDGVVAYELMRDGKKTEIPVRRGGLATDWPIVVLVNKGSASASEIVAGAIQDSGRGPLIGETTFGKGSVQQDFSLTDGSAVHITIANWLTPSGRNISKLGLTPNIEVKVSEDDIKNNRDPQLERAVEYLKTGK
jgi:carboxyl-terminal processing protease